MSPKTPGFYYFIVDMNYISAEGKTSFSFKTTLELIVKGIEPEKNHYAHVQNGYVHKIDVDSNISLFSVPFILLYFLILSIFIILV